MDSCGTSTDQLSACCDVQSTVGSLNRFGGIRHFINQLDTFCSFGDVDIALFSAWGSISKKFAHTASDAGATVCSLAFVNPMHPLSLQLNQETWAEIRRAACPENSCLVGYWEL